GALGFFLTGTSAGAEPSPELISPTFLFVAGMVVLFMGAAVYTILLATNCLTFYFSRPFFASFKRRLWVANLLTGLLLQMGFAFMVAGQLGPLLSRFLPPGVAMPAAFFGPFIAAQLFLVWFGIWAPLEKAVILRRLRV